MAHQNVIKRFKLYNIQSWSTDMDWIDLLTTGLNVFIARSETGKSILFKIFDLVCFPNHRGLKSRRALIRRGCVEGVCTLELTNGTIIKFTIKPTKTAFSMRKADETKESTWETPRLPKEIEEELGWIVDYDNQLILNMIDSSNGVGRLFINTSPKYNASLTKCITTEPKTTTAFANVNSWLDETTEKMNKMQVPMQRLQLNIDNTAYVNEVEAENKLSRAREINALWEQVDASLEGMKFLEAVLTTKPKETQSIDSAAGVYEVKQLETQALQDVSELISLVEHRPLSATGIHIDEPACEEILNVEKSILKARGDFQEFMKVMQSKPKGAKLPAEAVEVYECWSAIGLATKQFTETIKLLQEKTQLCRQLATLKTEVNELEQQLGICPLCGSNLTK